MRTIARIDIKNESAIKGINLEGLRKIGDPINIAREYYVHGIDELLIVDSVASLYGRNNNTYNNKIIIRILITNCIK